MNSNRRGFDSKKIIAALIIMLLFICFALVVMLYGRLEEMQKKLDQVIAVQNMSDLYISNAASVKEVLDSGYAADVSLSDAEATLVIDSRENESLATMEDEEEPEEGGEHNVYLTFDDGPSSNTPVILKTLQEYGVKATFFVNGKQNENLRDMITRIHDEGHTVAMHSYSHKYSSVYASTEAFSEDLEQIEHLLYAQTGVHPTLYRFPGGSSNSVSRGRMGQFIKVLQDENIEYVDWNISSGDATGTTSVSKEVIAKNVLDGYDQHLYRTSVVLMHDTDLRDSTAEALPDIIKGLRDRGAVLLPITDKTPAVHHVE